MIIIMLIALIDCFDSSLLLSNTTASWCGWLASTSWPVQLHGASSEHDGGLDQSRLGSSAVAALYHSRNSSDDRRFHTGFRWEICPQASRLCYHHPFIDHHHCFFFGERLFQWLLVLDDEEMCIMCWDLILILQSIPPSNNTSHQEQDR